MNLTQNIVAVLISTKLYKTETEISISSFNNTNIECVEKRLITPRTKQTWKILIEDHDECNSLKIQK